MQMGLGLNISSATSSVSVLQAIQSSLSFTFLTCYVGIPTTSPLGQGLRNEQESGISISEQEVWHIVSAC